MFALLAMTMILPSFPRRGLRGGCLSWRTGQVPTRTPDPLPLRGVPRRGEGCNRSMKIILERTSESHPPSLRDTSLKGGGFHIPSFSRREPRGGCLSWRHEDSIYKTVKTVMLVWIPLFNPRLKSGAIETDSRTSVIPRRFRRERAGL